MPTISFIHAADVHIDSPLQGLSQYEGAPTEELRTASRTALTRLVDLAIERAVDFVVIAGDLFDGPWKDVSTGLWTFAQFRRLGGHDIPLYLLRGNHDAASKILSSIPFPEKVHCFDHEKAGTFSLEKIKTALHGRSFPTGAVDFDITEGYPEAKPGWFNIGVLHTSLGGNTLHDTYAPTSEEKLCRFDYDYWALGHIHQREVIRDADPVIAYSGACQGRHVNEPDAKGCYLVEVDADHHVSLEFHPLDAVRWFRAEVEVEEADDVDEIVEKAKVELANLQAAHEDRLLAVRLNLGGTCGVAGLLNHPKQQDELIARMQDEANALGAVWLEKVEFAMTPSVDRDALRARGDMLCEILREIDALRAAPERLRELVPFLEDRGSAARNAMTKGGRDVDEELLRHWLDQTENFLVASLSGGDDED